MPRKGRRRKKSRTHVVEENEQPIAVITRRGKIDNALKHLLSELRLVLYPNTPLKFKDSSKSSLKDLMRMAKYFTVDYLLYITSTENSSYLKFVKIAHGPTFTFKINSFTLSSDVRSYQKKAAKLQPDFKAPPLLIMNGVEGLTNSLFKGVFPSLDILDLKIERCRRIVLITHENGVYHFRHYFIKTRMAGVTHTLRKLARNEVPNLNKFNSAGEWADTGAASDSEYEDAPGQKVAIKLVELGPRLEMTLHKIEEGVSEGKVLYHAVKSKSLEEDQATEQLVQERKKLKEERKRIQQENVKQKLLKRRQKLEKLALKKRKLSVNND